MAIYKILVTRDIKANVYSLPMFVLHTGQAIKGFQDECQGKGQSKELAMHPEDYELYIIGEYDDEQAIFLTFDNAPGGASDTLAWGKRQLAAGTNFKA